MSAGPGIGWATIARLGLVQAALGAIVALTTSAFNRVMAVELALAASVPAGLVAWHYALQLARPHWGHASDAGGSRTRWILGGMASLGCGAVLAAVAIALTEAAPAFGLALAVVAYTAIGAGVGAAGTTLLALMASSVAPARRPAAAALVWIMMIAGIVVAAGGAGAALEPFSYLRLVEVSAVVAAAAFALAAVAVRGVEAKARALAPPREAGAAETPLGQALAQVWADRLARLFTIFVFASMLAYSMQDLILEPFAGLVFGFSPAASTQLGAVQHMGVLAGMGLVGLAGTWAARDRTAWLMRATVFGCVASAAALGALAAAGLSGGAWPLRQTVFALGFANGAFAVAAIGLMMSFAGLGGSGREGVRMGVWGAAQGIAFGLGGFAGAVALDAARAAIGHDPQAFALVFGAEATLFLIAAAIAVRLASPVRAPEPSLTLTPRGTT